LAFDGWVEIGGTLNPLEPLIVLAVLYFVVYPLLGGLWRFAKKKFTKLPPIPDFARESTLEDSVQPDDKALSWWKESRDAFISVATTDGRVNYYAYEDLPGALRSAILNGQHPPASVTQLHSKSADNTWAASELQLGEFAKRYFKLNVLYHPIWACAMEGMFWGILTGIGFKLVDAAVSILQIEPAAAVFFAVMAAIGVLIPRIGVVGMVAAVFAMKFFDVSVFSSLVILGAMATGAVFGGLSGMTMGGVMGMIVRHIKRPVPEVKREGSDVLRKAVFFPLMGTVLGWGLYIGLLLPWAKTATAGYANSLLVKAIGQCDKAAALELLRSGANARSDESSHALAAAAACEDGAFREEVMVSLLDGGADVNDMACSKNSRPTTCGTLLQIATMNGDTQVVERLLEKGAEEVEKANGEEALFAAARLKNPRIAKLLLDHGADVNAKQGLCKMTALRIAAAHGNTKVAQLLLERGAETNTLDCTYTTALQMAVYGENQELVQLLLEKGADPNLNNPSKVGFLTGQTALSLAARWGNMEVVRLLIDKGAEVANDRRAVVDAHVYMKADVMKLLLEKGAKPY
jgi:ankyrin repeat protein